MVKADQAPAFLLTGFGPFPGVPNNASADVVKTLVRRAREEFPEYKFVSTVLPTEWARGPSRVEALHVQHAPVAALHFGVAAGTRGFRVESQAANHCRRSKDAAGALPAASHFSASGPAVCHPIISAEKISAALTSQDYPTDVSNDAGGYICNAVFYHSLLAAHRSNNRCFVGFVHIPADLSRPLLKLERAVSGSLEIVKVIIAEQKAALLTSA